MSAASRQQSLRRTGTRRESRTRANDLPLDAICRAIEIDLRESVGDKAPEPLLPVDFQLR